jgi:hypothetical protein
MFIIIPTSDGGTWDKRAKYSLGLRFRTPHHEDMEAYTSTILNLYNIWRGVISFTPRSLYSRGNRTQYPLWRRLGGPQRQSELYGEDKVLLPLLGIEPRLLGRPARSLVAYHWVVMIQMKYMNVAFQSESLKWRCQLGERGVAERTVS